MADLCCTNAVYDSAAGWWCPDHGDQMESEGENMEGEHIVHHIRDPEGDEAAHG